MESTISLRYTTLPNCKATFRLSSSAIGVRASRSVHLSLSHASLSHCSLRHRAAAHAHTHVSGRVNCMLDGNERISVPSKKEGSDNNMIRGMTGLSLVMACVLGVFNFSNKMHPKSITAYANLLFGNKSTPVSTSFGDPYQFEQFDRAQFALNSVLEMMKHLNSPDQNPPQIREFSAEEINKLKLYAAGLTKSQKPDEALQILTKEYKRLKEYQRLREQTEEEYPESEEKLNLDMALIEILILQGKYKNALELLDSWIDKIIKESRDPNGYGGKLNDDEKIKLVEKYPYQVVSKPKIFLYKAILHTMLGKKDAAKWGKAFGDTI